MIRNTYPKVSFTKETISVLLNEVTKVTDTISAVKAEYTSYDDYVRALYKQYQIPIPASEASDSQ
jgi:hypothetical protein